jgi:Ca2+-transporting ATPase
MNHDARTASYHNRTIEDIGELLKVNPSRGLSENEAIQRIDQYGPNRMREAKKRSFWKILIDQFKSMVIWVLLIAGVIALAFQHWAEGIAIVAVLIVNAVIGFVTEWKATRSMEALQKMEGDTIRVRRDDTEMEIETDKLVPGDIVIFEGGDLVPGDIRLIESNNLKVNESALTGESVPVKKQTEPVDDHATLADRKCMLYKGTTVIEGSGEGIVVGTGMKTELGHISELAETAEKEATPLQKRLDQLGRRLAWITLIVAAGIAVVGLLAGHDMRKMIETAIALGVAAIPEGLPIVATIALARGMHLMARRNALIKRLPAVETLGATNVIFTDKTGTLTENRMTLRKICTFVGDFLVDTKKKEIKGKNNGDHFLVQRIIEVCVLCNNASLRDIDGDLMPDTEHGDPTETALLWAGLIFDLDRKKLLEQKPEVREVPFDAEKMMMATYHEQNEKLEVAVKGAPSKVIEACQWIAENEAKFMEHEIDDKIRNEWLNRAEELARQGLRVLGIADKIVESEESPPYENLRFLGLVGLQDPPRRDVRNAIAECQAAGIRVVMVTGDQPATAAAIAFETGIIDEKDPVVIHGKDLMDPDDMTDEERSRITQTSIFARVSPEQKLHLIKLMQTKNQTVAMTGDGVNDAPALKKADIGIAMGQRGTDAARQVADMILLDDAFPSIVTAVRYGRIIFGNIRKSVMFMLCTNVAEVIVVGLAAVLGGFFELPIPLLPLQILYLNVITDVFPALALGMGQGEPDIMAHKPRSQSESILTTNHWAAIGGWAVLIAMCVLGALAVAFYKMDFDHHRAVTVSFLTLAFGKLWFVYNLQNPGSKIFKNDIVQNSYIAGSIVLCIVLLLAAIYLPGLSDVLKTKNPGWQGWLILIEMSLIPFIWGQMLRLIQAYRKNKT